MRRLIDYHLLLWKSRSTRKPLLLRGARQVGKTHALRELGKTFATFVEINLEFNEGARAIVEKDLDPHRIVRQLSELLQIKIIPGSTLLFFDEIQKVPQAITALRYFYEMMPELHVAAAGSLLDFAIEEVGIPVGRVSSLFMYPLSFIEFLVALGHVSWAELLVNYCAQEILSEPLHVKLMDLVATYLAIGGMPEAVNEWVAQQTSWTIKTVHSDLIYTYQQDFGKYAKSHQIKYLNLLFAKSIDQIGNKFVYSRVGEYQKREIQPALELLEMAGLVHRVIRSTGQGVPLGAQADLDDFKIIFIDVGLSQAILKLDLIPWLLDSTQAFINKGELVEAYVGQEIIAYSDPTQKESLFYWHRDKRSSQAEIDYLLQINNVVIPVEVKAGGSRRLKSMQIFLEEHPQSPYGLRFGADNYFEYQAIISYPLYAFAFVMANQSPIQKKALHFLTQLP